jgi:hypothetical protein
MDLAVIEVDIAVTLFLEGDLVNSQYYLKQSYDRSASMARELATETGNTEVINWVQRPTLKRSQSTLLVPGVAYFRLAKSSARAARSSEVAVRNV